MGSTFGALRGQKVANTSSKIDAKIGIGKGRFRGGPSARKYPWLVAGGGYGGGKPSPGGYKVQKKGTKEVRKKQRKKE